MNIPIELIYHYPWLPSLKENFSSIASMDPVEFIKKATKKYPFGEIQERISKLFKAAFENLEQISDYKVDELNVYIYLIIKILLYVLNNRIITNRIANIYSKKAHDDLLEDSEFNLYAICKDIELKILYYEQPIYYGKIVLKDYTAPLKTKFRIHYTDFLKLAAYLRDDYRKLVNNSLSNGYVFIQKKALIRLIQEYIRMKFLINENENPASLEALKNPILKLKEFKEIYENILHEWELKKEHFEYSFEIGFKEGSDLSNSFPPCIIEILSKAQEGQNLTHTERLYLVFFLHALNYPVVEIINIFSTLPDFDKNKTTYQVEFAKKKAYTPHSCSTLKSLNLCKAVKYKDELCLEGYYSKKLEVQKKISHPLFYVQFKQFQSSKKEKLDKKQIKNENE
ncbi:MAG: hypothetical protein ACFFAN_16510 [Promethearchaeota archaeon]